MGTVANSRANRALVRLQIVVTKPKLCCAVLQALNTKKKTFVKKLWAALAELPWDLGTQDLHICAQDLQESPKRWWQISKVVPFIVLSCA